ncbi:MAG: hypothetical protein DMG50_13460 [Acidobacteria bacterium]|nr:MAG: hypothetical protein DMG50_13460 [Acidobacteriota bacterium]
MASTIPYFNNYAFKSANEFLPRLRFFLKQLQPMFTCKFAVEIRNKTWLDAKFVDVLREHEQIIEWTLKFETSVPPAGRV